MYKGVVIVLLAAGSSKRMGRPKQLLPYKGSTLLNTALKTCQAMAPTKLILGANANEIIDTLSSDVEYIYNENYEEGMGGSVSVALQDIDLSNLDGVLICLADQILVSTQLLNKILVARANTNKNIIATSYCNTYGPPIYFSKVYFDRLMQLTGEQGAKKIVFESNEDVCFIADEAAGFDIDTEEDYEKLISGL